MLTLEGSQTLSQSFKLRQTRFTHVTSSIAIPQRAPYWRKQDAQAFFTYTSDQSFEVLHGHVCNVRNTLNFLRSILKAVAA